MTEHLTAMSDQEGFPKIEYCIFDMDGLLSKYRDTFR